MKKICEFLLGSYAYGLEVSDSDKDIRYVFLNTGVSQILGLDKYQHQQGGKSEDSFGFEIRFFFNLLKRGNTQTYETIFLDSYLFKDSCFDIILDNKFQFIDSERLFSCLRGYIQGEKSIIVGKNTGKLGEKRKQQIEQFGYSYRNAVHALRLLRTGIIFFRDNIYPVNIVKIDKEFGEFIKDIKINPQKHTKEGLLAIIDEMEKDLVRVFEGRKENYKFNNELADNIILDLYLPLLEKYRENRYSERLKN